MTPEEVCDAVFGEWTRDCPTIKSDCHISTSIKREWNYWFEGPKPDYYDPDPFEETPEHALDVGLDLGW